MHCTTYLYALKLKCIAYLFVYINSLNRKGQEGILYESEPTMPIESVTGCETERGRT